jgi:hypothetical protein
MWNAKLGPFQYRVVRGGPVQAGTSRLTLIARVVSYTRRRATIGEDGIQMQGQQYVDVVPVAVVSEQRGWRRILPVFDLTRVIVGALAGICLASYVASRAVGRAIDERASAEE